MQIGPFRKITDKLGCNMYCNNVRNCLKIFSVKSAEAAEKALKILYNNFKQFLDTV